MSQPRFALTSTELRLKRERMSAAFDAGRTAVEELGLSYFLSYGSALSFLREGRFQPRENGISIGIFSWALAAFQRSLGGSAVDRDKAIVEAFLGHGFRPVDEVNESHEKMPNQTASANKKPSSVSVCPRMFAAETWSADMAIPIVFEFLHKESLVPFAVNIFFEQYGFLWDFADGGAETSCGWRYTLFSAQEVELNGQKTFVMPPQALEEHYGSDWQTPSESSGYIQCLSTCKNRCQLLRVWPFNTDIQTPKLPEREPWANFRNQTTSFRMEYAKATMSWSSEVPPEELDLSKIESKPMLLFQAAAICKAEGNVLLKSGDAKRALARYEEGLCICEKARAVLLHWRLFFCGIHGQKAEEDRKRRGLKYADCQEGQVPREFRADEAEERDHRIALALNAAQAALQIENWELAEARAGSVLEFDSRNQKALYRRGMARRGLGRKEPAMADFWLLLKVTNFEGKKALQQLLQLGSRDEVQKELRRLKSTVARDQRLSELLSYMDDDGRVTEQEERRARYLADLQHRREEGLKDISFDDWVSQYEWRYDAEGREKAREAWPETFCRSGPAPLPVEGWEVDFLTHKEIKRISYMRETAALAARTKPHESNQYEALKKDDCNCPLEYDEEDEALFRDASIKKGYHYWW
eukprot:TRINITY_DN20977_c0_g1_i1.p1 TRINITY_DN20977_c0_g1~~TRINITY_DN20977_c0_g1_i1.p1  ORF type:complete len:643 (-),score=113.55 TRINITY_DN20977_c0_g1_i1:291-2219(-)